MHVYKCKDVYVCMYVLVCNYVSVCVYLLWVVNVCVVVACCNTQTRSCDPNSIIGYSDWCTLWTRYTGDSKTDLRVDSEISTGLCSEDQMAIQIQNRVI